MQDIDALLRNWEVKPGKIQARMVKGNDGRQVIQMRVDLGILQMEKLGRPDGVRPHGYATYLEFLKHRAQVTKTADRAFIINEEQCQEADREFSQFYHRRICWLALQNYTRAIADADHTLAFMDFVKQHSPDEEYTHAHEQYRGFVLFQRTQAASAAKLELDDAEGAIDEIRSGLEQMKQFFASFEMEEHMEEHPMVEHLRKFERSLRDKHGINATLQEQLAAAIANEKYEEAARLRDVIRNKQQC